MSEKITHLDEKSFSEFIKNNQELVVVDVWATWCGPCRMIAPILDKVANEMENVKVTKVDADANANLIAQFGVRGIPTLIMFKNGLEVGRHIGALNYGQLKSLIDKHA